VLNLIIDIGNSRTKVAIFNHGDLMISLAVNELTPENISMLKLEYPALDQAIVSSTAHIPNGLIERLTQELEQVIILDHTTPVPIENLYETPETLGKDRLAGAVGANFLFPNQNLLIIDAGTAITYDYVNEKNQYLGGFISPGVTMRLRALHEFTGKLPLLSPDLPDSLDGKNTKEAILGGVWYGIQGEMQKMIEKSYWHQDNFKIILTGGDSNYFEKLLKNYNFVALEVTLLGLNRMLEFNQLTKYQ
jgi:type III pantothenate kinase